MTKLKIRRPDDFHVHLRQDVMLRDVIPATALVSGRALVMPNTLPPVLTGDDARNYAGVIREVAARIGAPGFEPLMTIKIVATTTPETIRDAKAKGVIAGRRYPEGVTTNSEDGVRELQALYPVFETMQEEGMVLCLHGETPGVFCMDRELVFATETLPELARAFPRLRMVLEHVTSEAGISAVEELPDTVAATITPHHLLFTLDDVIGDKLRPHHFCKPIAKAPEDRQVLIDAAMSGSPKYFLGTDSAPHARDQKECASGCAGVFCAPVAMEVLAEVFEDNGALERLEAFTSEFGARFYGLPLNEDYVTLVKSPEPYAVPDYLCIDGATIAPLRAGGTLRWTCQLDG